MVEDLEMPSQGERERSEKREWEMQKSEEWDGTSSAVDINASAFASGLVYEVGRLLEVLEEVCCHHIVDIKVNFAFELVSRAHVANGHHVSDLLLLEPVRVVHHVRPTLNQRLPQDVRRRSSHLAVLSIQFNLFCARQSPRLLTSAQKNKFDVKKQIKKDNMWELWALVAVGAVVVAILFVVVTSSKSANEASHPVVHKRWTPSRVAVSRHFRFQFNLIQI
jgi:hypothetical protein